MKVLKSETLDSTMCALAYAYEHSIIHDPAACRHMQHCMLVRCLYMCLPGAHMCASAARAEQLTRYCTRVARGALQELDSWACQPSRLGKIGQWPGDRDSQARQAALGALGAGAHFVREPWRCALVSAPQRPCQPCWSGRRMMSLIRVLIRKQILLVEWVELFRTLGEAGRHCSTSRWSLVCAGAGPCWPRRRPGAPL